MPATSLPAEAIFWDNLPTAEPSGDGLWNDLGTFKVKRVLDHIILYGQSLALGVDPNGASVISSADTDHKMFNGGVRAHYDTSGIVNVNSAIDPDQIATLATLTEQLNPNDADYGETFATGIASKLTNRSLFSATARAAYPVAQLSRSNANFVDNWHFANTIATAIAGKELADAAGYTYDIPAIIWKHGEGDGAAGTSKSSYKTDVTALFDDLKTHLKNATEKNLLTVFMICDQQGFQQSGKTYEDIAVAAIELHRTSGNGIVCAGPTYAEEFTAVNDVHMTSNGYRNYGERLGRVVLAGSSWNPCYITGASRTTTTISVTVHVPSPPLTTDTTLVSSIANSGFTYSGANITDVSITDDGTGDNTATITITIDADAGGNLGYAYANGTDLRIGPTSGPRGNIRDSESAVTANDGTNLYNWLCVDQWVVA